MPALVEPLRSHRWLRLAAMALLGAGTAGCSADSTRFGENPFSSPYASRNAPRSEVTGSVPATYASSAPRIEQRPLAAPVASAPPPVIRSDTTGSIPQARANGGWSWEGGTAVTVEQGETLASLSARHGVPAAAIAQANGLTTTASLLPGQRLVIPRYGGIGAPAASAPATRVASNAPMTPVPAPAHAQSSAVGHVHVVQAGETLMSLGRRYHKTRAEIARANNLSPDHRVQIGQRLVIPGLRAAAQPSPPAPKTQTAPAPAPVAAPVSAPPAGPKLQGTSQKVANAEATSTARVASPVADPEPEAANETSGGGAPSFRWPVRGRVIAGFGPKPNGQQNDGINLAVPEGTSVKASDDGVVAYAGNELKGYGNLVLVRHGNGYVTAYAHASELLVKRGDQIKRGQIIAKAGQTGNVGSPQLHFEIRKGKDPVDPMQYLSGG